MRSSRILPFDLVRIGFMLMKSVSRERFDQNLISQCENWGRVSTSQFLEWPLGRVWFGVEPLSLLGLLMGLHVKLRPESLSTQMQVTAV